jgi:hypothetical protein
MAATFDITGDWFGSIRAGYETATKVAGKPNPTDGYLWRRKIYTIERARSGKTLTAFAPNVGGSTTGDNLTVQNGADIIAGSASDTYLLQKDDVVPTPQGSGMWEEQQIAVSYTDWEEWLIPV